MTVTAATAPAPPSPGWIKHMTLVLTSDCCLGFLPHELWNQCGRWSTSIGIADHLSPNASFHRSHLERIHFWRYGPESLLSLY